MSDEAKVEYNAFDNIAGITDPADVAWQAAIDREKWEKLDHLIHKAFVQNEHGAELLEMWKQALIMVPTVTESATQFQAGMREGEKTFIRNILLTIEKIEKQ